MIQDKLKTQSRFQENENTSHVLEKKYIFAKNISDKVSLFKIYDKVFKLNNKRKTKWTKDPNRCFTEEDMQITNKHMRRCSTLYAISQLHIKTTKRTYLRERQKFTTDNTK